MTDTETTTPTRPLRAALVKAQAELEAPTKGRTAKVKSKRTGIEFEYKFANMNDVLEKALPVLTKHNIAHTQTTRIENNNLILITTLMHPDDEQTISGEYPVCSVGADHQSMGAAMSYARRYSFCAAIGLQPDEDNMDGADAARTSGAPGERISTHSAKTELNYQAMVDDIRSAKTVKKLSNWRARLVEREAVWPSSYIEELGNEIDAREHQIMAEEAERLDKLSNAELDERAMKE